MEKAESCMKKRENGKGLASARSRTRGDKLWYRLKDMLMETRYALQRAWRGYDTRAGNSLGPCFAEQMPVLLREFKKQGGIHLRIPGASNRCSEAESEQILDDMIFYFENCSEYHVYQRLYGVPIWVDGFNRERLQKSKAECSRCREEAMRLFQVWCFALWY